MQKKTFGINSRWFFLDGFFLDGFKPSRNIVLLNKFLDNLGKTVRNSRQFDPNRLETILDSLGQIV